MKVLITGARGRVGSELVPALEQEHDLRLLSRRPLTDDPRWRQVDIGEIGPTVEAAEGVDAIVHLAIAAEARGSDEGDALNVQRFDTNVKGTYNIFEAACRARVQRVIYTSSVMVCKGYPRDRKVDADAPAKPVGTYALTKYLGEEIAEYYATVHGLSVLCLRIAGPVDIGDPASRNEPILPQRVPLPDLIQAYRLALAIPDVTFEIVTIVGESTKHHWDLSKAKILLGYRPQYCMDDLGYTFR